MSCRIASLAVALTTFCILPIASADEPQDELAGLATKYPLGNIFLTFIPLNDLRDLFNDKQKFDALKLDHPESALLLLKTFLEAQHSVELKSGTAFLAVNVNSWAAGYKRVSDRDGAISTIPWDAEQTKNIARFCDAYLAGLARVEKAYRAVADERKKDADRRVEPLWRNLKSLDNDPYVPSSQLRDVLGEMRLLIEDLKPAEKEELRVKSKSTFDEISKFKLRHEAALLEAPKGIPGLKGAEPELRLRLRPKLAEGTVKEIAPLMELRWRQSNANTRAFREAIGRPSGDTLEAAEQPKLRLLMELDTP